MIARIVAAESSDSIIEQVWPLLVAGLFALIGVLVGKWTERSHQTTAWFRDNRLAAYVGLVEAMAQVDGATYHVVMAIAAHQDPVPLIKARDDAVTAMHQAQAKVEVLGSGAAVDAMRRWQEAFNEMRDAVQQRDTSAQNDAGRRQTERKQVFIDAAKESLAKSERSNRRSRRTTDDAAH